ncbi:MAG: metallopeptidase TldD-related protein [Bdellovibrionaceae bacterium]|nr:metallopeptidase TldD-related protein [Pseudobdellovibrionaceae bacterium]
MKSDLIDSFYDRLSPLAKKDGLDFDLYAYNKDQTQITFQKKELKDYSCSQSCHVNLRVLKGDKAGTSYAKDFSQSSLESCYKRAKDSLQFTDQKTAGRLSLSQVYQNSSDFYDKNFESISLEDKLEKARELNSACLTFDSRVQPVSSSVSDSSIVSAFVNSKEQKSSYFVNNIFAISYCLAVDKYSRSNGFENFHSRNYDSINFKKIGQQSAEKAIKKLNYKIPQTKKYPVIFKSGQAVSALLSSLVNLMSGKSIFEGKSLFKDSLDHQMFSNSFSLYDDPLALWGANSKTFDGEGFAVEKTILAEKGFLRNYLTSSFYAKALKAPHTKKAYWLDTGVLDISGTNLVMSEGESSLGDLLSEFSQVVVIDYLKGFAGYNPISGDFSIESEGFLYEWGEFKPICQFTVSGNIIKLFSNILQVGNDSQIYAGSIKAPSFLSSDLMIAGK